MTEARLITFRKLKSICDDKQARGAVYYCYKPRMDFTDYKCTSKNCPVWKGLKKEGK